MQGKDSISMRKEKRQEQPQETITRLGLISEHHRQPCQSPEERVRPPFLLLGREPHTRESARECAEDNLPDHASERAADAEVRAMAEGDVPVIPAADVELGRLPGIARDRDWPIPGSKRRVRLPRSSPHRLRHFRRRISSNHLYRAFIAEDLLDGERYECPGRPGASPSLLGSRRSVSTPLPIRFVVVS